MANVIRTTKTVCPKCVRELDGEVVLDGDEVYLQRTCPEHGPFRFLVSRNGAMYADFDRFFFEVLMGNEVRGKITNVWLVATADCQMKCKYCSIDMRHPFFNSMSMDVLNGIMDDYGNEKLTFSGGEPALHPHILDFFREATKRGITTQLATNGVALASKEFCQKLADAGVNEVRLSIESLDREQAKTMGSGEFFDPKVRAIENLHDLGITVSLSPTIFRDLNEDQIVACIEYAKDKPCIRSVGANGFAWVGGGRRMPQSHMIMPDEMMDTLCKRYLPENREDAFTFQKALIAVMQLVGIRLCLYTQLMLFFRSKTGMVPLTHFLNMKRLKKGMTWWERFAKSGRLVQSATLFLVLAFSSRLRAAVLTRDVLSLLMANLFQVRISRYPSRLFPVTMNTNCSVLSLDTSVGVRCMSKFLLMDQGELKLGIGTRGLLDIERRAIQQGSEKEIGEVE